MSILAASLMCGNMLKIDEELKELEKARCDLLHLDVMDGVFVNNLALGPEWIESIAKRTKIPMDIHLATITPEKYIDMFSPLKPEYLSFHIEAASNPSALIQKIHSKGIKPGIVLNPETPLSAIESYFDQVELIIVMTVHTGFSGQEFIKDTLPKLQELNEKLKQMESPPLVEVDGNIHIGTIKWMKDFLPDVYVLGTSGLFDKKKEINYQEKLEKLRNEIEKLKIK